MIEFLFILIIICILASLAVVTHSDYSLQRAKQQLQQDLKLTKSLALSDKRNLLRDFNKPFRAQQQAALQYQHLQLWRLQFHTISNKVEGYIGTTYSIFAKRPRRDGSIDNKPMGYVSIAKNPLNGKCMSWYNYGDVPKECRDIRDERLKIEQLYGITDVYFEWHTQGCKKVHKTIFYDSFGQAYCGSSSLQPISKNAILVLQHKKYKTFRIKLVDIL